MDRAATAAPRGHVLGVALVAALGGFLFGFDTAVINGAVDAIGDEFRASKLGLGLGVSSALLGSAAGAVLAGRLADRFGRPRTMQVAAVVFFVGAVGSAVAQSLWDLSAWRLLGGIAVGIASVVAPTYIAEVAPADRRGRLGALQQLAIVVGIFIALLTDAVIAGLAGSAGSEWWLGLEAWRWMLLSAAVPATVYLAWALRIPESPRYLVMRGRDAEAAGVFARFEGGDGASQVAATRASISGEARPHLRDLRGPLGLLPVVWIGIGLSVLQQFVGINVIFYYSTTLWQSVGFSESDSLKITVITSVVNVVTTLIAIATIDRLGRKPLLLIGSVGMSVALVTLAVVFGTAGTAPDGDPDLSGAVGVVALLAANAFVFFFGLSWGPVVWVLLGEMFPNRIRALALSVAAGAQWIANWLVSTTFPSLSAEGLGLAYGLYAGFAILSVVFVLALVRETKGRTLEEMGAAEVARRRVRP